MTGYGKYFGIFLRSKRYVILKVYFNTSLKQSQWGLMGTTSENDHLKRGNLLIEFLFLRKTPF